MGGAEYAGTTRALLKVGERLNLGHIGIFTLVTAALSNVVSNVPVVMLLKTLVPRFAHALRTLAGNLTITGSVANIIVIERTRKEATITFRDYFRVGLPITVVTLALGYGWLSWVK